jgi:hypothetical protein
MKKTMYMAYITQHFGNRNDSISRRVWEDENGQRFIKVFGDWIELSYYQNNSHYEVFLDKEKY